MNGVAKTHIDASLVENLTTGMIISEEERKKDFKQNSYEKSLLCSSYIDSGKQQLKCFLYKFKLRFDRLNY